jgi:hypothetical protein
MYALLMIVPCQFQRRRDFCTGDLTYAPSLECAFDGQDHGRFPVEAASGHNDTIITLRNNTLLL